MPVILRQFAHSGIILSAPTTLRKPTDAVCDKDAAEKFQLLALLLWFITEEARFSHNVSGELAVVFSSL